MQTGLALAAVFVGSQLFVSQLEGLAVGLGVPGHNIALPLSPVATELPETMNAIIWVRQAKERLALANIRGAMMIHAAVPSALGLIITMRQNRLTAGRLSLVGLGYAAFAAIFISAR